MGSNSNKTTTNPDQTADRQQANSEKREEAQESRRQESTIVNQAGGEGSTSVGSTGQGVQAGGYGGDVGKKGEM